MVRLRFSIELNYDVSAPGGDFIFNIHAARTSRQVIVHEALGLSQSVQYALDEDPATRNRCLRLHANQGPLTVRYDATVDVDHLFAGHGTVAEVPVAQLPGAVLPYLYPSRYCQSDRLMNLASREFGQLPPGYSRAEAISQWVQQRVTFRSNSSDGSTSAVDTLIDRAGVCRDFAHLMIALCRAMNMPARFATGMDFGADPALGPPDFHAYVEVYLGHRWYLFDPSGTSIPMGFPRLATGRDAADVAFATMFGGITSGAPLIHIEAVPGPDGKLVIPERLNQALSSDGA